MNGIKTARETVLAFCQSWFQQRDLCATTAYLAEDVTFVGTGVGETACGRAAMSAYLAQDIQEIPEPFSLALTVIHNQDLGGGMWNLTGSINLQNSQYTWRLWCAFILSQEEGGVAHSQHPRCRAQCPPGGERALSPDSGAGDHGNPAPDAAG